MCVRKRQVVDEWESNRPGSLEFQGMRGPSSKTWDANNDERALHPLLIHVYNCIPSPNRRRSFQDKPYEYVLVDSPRLAAVTADGRPFAEHIASREGKVPAGGLSAVVRFFLFS